jgi:hypothetical protein
VKYNVTCAVNVPCLVTRADAGCGAPKPPPWQPTGRVPNTKWPTRLPLAATLKLISKRNWPVG